VGRREGEKGRGDGEMCAIALMTMLMLELLAPTVI
jgi:hypothetical protein